jgi:hypothetical protein
MFGSYWCLFGDALVTHLCPEKRPKTQAVTQVTHFG